MRFTGKIFFLAAIVLTLVVAAPALALAGIIPQGPFGGYNDPLESTSTSTDPHGGYTTTSNYCKDCHAVHLATGSYRLTRADSASQACDFCHGETGVTTKKVVMNSNGHGLNQAQIDAGTVTAPDDTKPAFSTASNTWGCDDCHSVHDNQTVILKGSGYTTTKLLKKDPNPTDKTYLYYNPSLVDTVTKETTQTVSHWCSTCHNANFGSHKDPKTVTLNGTDTIVYGHDVSGTSAATDANGFVLEADVDPDDSVNKGPVCRQCHQADGEGNTSFPHYSSAPNMLKSGTSLTQLDPVCTGCHNTSSLP